jgi:hypothetical protein
MLRASMPEAAVDEHCQMSTGKNDVGSAALGQGAVKPEPCPGCMEGLAEGEFGSCVLLGAP